MTAPPARLQRLEQALQDQGKPWRLAPVVEALQALRGGPCTVAVTTGAALGDLTRFDNPRQLMSYLVQNQATFLGMSRCASHSQS